MALDREAVLRQAEKLLRQGKLDGAIQEYVRLVEEQPRDWNAINALGDLYARAGYADRAVEQFMKIADHLYAEGFIPKAVALYRKALKTKSDHEPAIAQLALIAGQQGLIADARVYYRKLAQMRKARGDERGAAECLISLGTLEEADAESRLAAARAAQQIGDNTRAALLFKEAAIALEKGGRTEAALEALFEAAELTPEDQELRSRIVQECTRIGQPERAQRFLTIDAAGDDPDLMLTLATAQMRGGRDEEGRVALTRLLTRSPDHHDRVLALARELATEGAVDRAHGCVDVLADAAILAGRWDRAIEALGWLAGVRPEIEILGRLVEVCVDAGEDEALRDAQRGLVAAYRAAGREEEARFVEEDLARRAEPGADLDIAVDVELAAGVLEIAPEPSVAPVSGAIEAEDAGRNTLPGDRAGVDPDRETELLEAAAELAVDLAAAAGVAGDAGIPTAPPEVAAIPGQVIADLEAVELAADESDAIVIEPLEVDLSAALAELGTSRSDGLPLPPQAAAPPSAGPGETGREVAPDLEAVFEDIRSRVSREQQVAEAQAQLERGLRLLEEGRLDEAEADLRAAARVPVCRFTAGAALGRLHVGRGEVEQGIEWLERAAQAPAPSPDGGYGLLYELADVLELSGESARALAVLIELEADAPGYRDVRERIERLTRVQAGSHGK